MDWKELAMENFRVARLLDREGHPRASVTRSYYAAYCAVAAEIDRRGFRTFGRFNNPSHSQLARLIAGNIGLTPARAVELDRTISALRLARKAADYKPAQIIDAQIAGDALRDAANVLTDFGIDIL